MQTINILYNDQQKNWIKDVWEIEERLKTNTDKLKIPEKSLPKTDTANK